MAVSVGDGVAAEEPGTEAPSVEVGCPDGLEAAGTLHHTQLALRRAESLWYCRNGRDCSRNLLGSGYHNNSRTLTCWSACFLHTNWCSTQKVCQLVHLLVLEQKKQWELRREMMWVEI
eukprot:CAMPEP_0170783272 /NCGR_PEP_ID=MMETSP0733-20121128/15416_1 /TAXON_ID=186038 /ORGANISM="Fragilariopsis kerguelensis, Strain L26-C5" /LENGTH=117 /DNA_ID=CAMNT_0011127911 /DNA_START=117 /DNA_END=471 /DNA_ORIENTATION=-